MNELVANLACLTRSAVNSLEGSPNRHNSPRSTLIGAGALFRLRSSPSFAVLPRPSLLPRFACWLPWRFLSRSIHGYRVGNEATRRPLLHIGPGIEQYPGLQASPQ